MLDAWTHPGHVDTRVGQSLAGVQDIVDGCVAIPMNCEVPAFLRPVQRHRGQLVGFHVGKTPVFAVQVWLALQTGEALVGPVSHQLEARDAGHRIAIPLADARIVPSLRPQGVEGIGTDARL